MNPSLALLWKCWNRTRTALLMNFLISIGLAMLFALYLVPTTSANSINSPNDSVTVLYVVGLCCFLLCVMTKMTFNC